jgi:hypothetical protein
VGQVDVVSRELGLTCTLLAMGGYQAHGNPHMLQLPPNTVLRVIVASEYWLLPLLLTKALGSAQRVGRRPPTRCANRHPASLPRAHAGTHGSAARLQAQTTCT